MRALVELTPAERKTLMALTGEEREAVVDQLLERVREELEWQIVVENARVAAASAPELVARAIPPPPPTLPSRKVSPQPVRTTAPQLVRKAPPQPVRATATPATAAQTQPGRYRWPSTRAAR